MRTAMVHLKQCSIALLAATIWISGVNASAQVPLAQQQEQAAHDQQTSTSLLSSQASSDENGNVGSQLTTTISTAQIISLLDQYPDLMVELKSMVADRMQEQGVTMDAVDISDETLYQQIVSNPSLQASIGTYLQARGYMAEGDDGASTYDLTGTTDDDSSSAQFSGHKARLSTESGAAPSPDQSIVAALPRATRSPANATAGIRGQAAAAGRDAASSSTDTPQVLRQPAPYNLQSMRDLYTQIPDSPLQLRRFGSDVFINRSASGVLRGVTGSDTPLDIPLGPDYVLGSGDTLAIDVWGGVTLSITRAIGRDGRILLPEAGSVQIAGLPLAKAQALIEAALKPQYRDAQVAVTVSQLHSVRIYVVGDVQRPGGYDISSLATPVSALYAAGGPTSVGSLRVLHHLRGDKLVENIDLYEFLLNGIRADSARFESGDTLQVPPLGAQVAIAGAVKRPAIYELKGKESSLAAVVEDAGGLSAAASLSHVVIERIDANQRRETITLPDEVGDPNKAPSTLTSFMVRDGDRIRIQPLLPYSERAIYLEGHVARPGRRSYTDGMQLSSVLQSYRDLLPEPAMRGEIVRLASPDLHAETINFNIADVLIGNTNIALQPFDTIRVFGRYEVDAPRVTIRGEVLHPGNYPLSEGMTAAQLVRMAGGFKRDAQLDKADLTSYSLSDGGRIVGTLTDLHIGAAVNGADMSEDVTLKPGDILSVHQITGWNDIGESVTIAGEVRYPGTYGFKDGERLSSVLRRAGGMLPGAYPMGAVLVRDQVRELEEKSRDELVRQIETNSAAARLSPSLGGGDTSATLQLIKAQQEQVLADLKSHPATGRMVINIDADIDSWSNTSTDIELRRGDVLTVPKRPGFVLVTGQVYNATGLTFSPNKPAGWYLSRAGGSNATANRREIFIIRANGSVIGRHSSGWFQGDVLATKLDPGDVIVVPQKIIGSSLLWRNLLTTAQLASSIAITAAVASF